MKVWIVTKTYFNGEGDSTSVAAVCSSQEKAEAKAKQMNEASEVKSGGSSYRDTFEAEWDDYEVDE